MNIYFNDLTLNAINDKENGQRILKRFLSEVLIPVMQKTGLSHICCNDRQTIQDKCIQKNGIATQAFYTFFRAPYVDNDFSNSPDEDRYINSKFYIKKDSKEIECHDLGCAVMKKSITLGFPSEEYWKKIDHKIYEYKSPREYNVLCLTINQHIQDQKFQDWVDETFYSEPEKSKKSINEKEVSLRDDHGKDKLEEFAKKIICSPYVTEVVNSAPFHPNQKEFIAKNQIFKDGLIEICLHWTSQGLGMVLKTTAKNKFQAQKIAKILTDEYDK